ncbi:hypothetical protein EMCRGX_G016578 [Ephydatia muelleri]
MRPNPEGTPHHHKEEAEVSTLSHPISIQRHPGGPRGSGQGNNLTRDHSKSRLADILLPNWFLGQTGPLHVSITSPLTILEAGVLAKTAAQVTEARKHQPNDPKCSELEWVCPHGGMEPGVKRPLLSSPQSTCKPECTTPDFNYFSVLHGL